VVAEEEAEVGQDKVVQEAKGAAAEATEAVDKCQSPLRAELSTCRLSSLGTSKYFHLKAQNGILRALAQRAYFYCMFLLLRIMSVERNTILHLIPFHA